MTDPRIVAHRDQDALNALRLGSVVLDRRGEVWQVLLVPTASQGPTRGWFRLLAAGTAHGAAAVAEAGPLRVLYNRDLDIPTHVQFCARCMGMTVELEDIGSECTACGGMGWRNELDGSLLTLPEAIAIAASITPHAPLQAMLPPESLLHGMTVMAEPKPHHAAVEGPAKGRVVDVIWEDGEQYVVLDTFAPPVAIIRLHFRVHDFSFRPLDE